MVLRALLASTALIGGAAQSAGAPSYAAPARATAAPARATTSATPPASPARSVSVTKLLGQRIMVGFGGPVASGSLLSRIRAGRVGSVILFRANILSSAQLRALTGSLQRAARQGGNPPILISTDQEGGQVKRLPNGPPGLSPPQMAATGSPSRTYGEGVATGRYLKGVGINWDLAPVLDVPTFGGAFIWQQGRAFSFNANTTATFGNEFARGLQHGGVAATGKHFPGVGSAAVDTDNKLDELRPSAAQRSAALQPYRTAIAGGLDTVMLSTAGFPGYDPSGAPSALSTPIATGLLRTKLHFRGVTITDALGTPTGHDEVTAGELAARAGADVLLYTDDAAGELPALLHDYTRGRLSRASIVAAYDRIVALKRRVGGG